MNEQFEARREHTGFVVDRVTAGRIEMKATAIQGDHAVFIVPDSADIRRLVAVVPWSWEWVALKAAEALIGFGANKVLEQYLFSSAPGAVDASAVVRAAGEEFKRLLHDALLDNAVLQAESTLQDAKRFFSLYQNTGVESWLVSAMQSASHANELLVSIGNRNGLQGFGSLQVSAPVYFAILQEYTIVRQDARLKDQLKEDINYFADRLSHQYNVYINWFRNRYSREPYQGGGAGFCVAGWCWGACYPYGGDTCATVGESYYDAGGLEFAVGWASRDGAEASRQNSIGIWLNSDEAYATAHQIITGWRQMRDHVDAWDMQRHA